MTDIFLDDEETDGSGPTPVNARGQAVINIFPEPSGEPPPPTGRVPPQPGMRDGAGLFEGYVRIGPDYGAAPVAGPVAMPNPPDPGPLSHTQWLLSQTFPSSDASQPAGLRPAALTPFGAQADPRLALWGPSNFAFAPPPGSAPAPAASPGVPQMPPPIVPLSPPPAPIWSRGVMADDERSDPIRFSELRAEQPASVQPAFPMTQADVSFARRSALPSSPPPSQAFVPAPMASPAPSTSPRIGNWRDQAAMAPVLPPDFTSVPMPQPAPKLPVRPFADQVTSFAYPAYGQPGPGALPAAVPSSAASSGPVRVPRVASPSLSPQVFTPQTLRPQVFPPQVFPPRTPPTFTPPAGRQWTPPNPASQSVPRVEPTLSPQAFPSLMPPNWSPQAGSQPMSSNPWPQTVPHTAMLGLSLPLAPHAAPSLFSGAAHEPAPVPEASLQSVISEIPGLVLGPAFKQVGDGILAIQDGSRIIGSSIFGGGGANPSGPDGGRLDSGLGKSNLFSELGDWFSRGVSPQTRKAMEDSIPTGDLTKPWTWSAGQNPSGAGYTALGLNLFGGMLPTLIVSTVTKHPLALVVVGSIPLMGAMMREARNLIDRMANTPSDGPGSPPLIALHSKYYQRLREAGFTHEEAVRLTQDQAERYAMLFSFGPAVLSGMSFSRFLNITGRNELERALVLEMLKRAGLITLEQGVVQVIQTVVTKVGIGIGTETPLDTTEGTLPALFFGMFNGSLFAVWRYLTRTFPPAPRPPGNGTPDKEPPPKVSHTDTDRAAENVWELPPVERGVVLEQIYGHNVPASFRVIDRIEGGTITSIKSIDLNSPSYLIGNRLKTQLRGMINAVSNYNGTSKNGWKGETIDQHQIKNRGLDLIIPHKGTKFQQFVLDEAVKYGQSLPNPVQINIIIHR